jgi:hypothetical protein
MSSNKQKSRSKSAITNVYNERIKTLETNLVNGGVATTLIDECRRLSMDLFKDALKIETEVSDLKGSLKKMRKETVDKRPATAYQLFCKSIRDSVKNDFIASCPRVVEDVTDPTTKVVSQVEKIEYVDSKGVKRRCVATGVPITVLQGVFSVKWDMLDADAKSVFVAEASKLKAEHVAKHSNAKDDASGSASVDASVVEAPASVESSDTATKKRKSRKDATVPVTVPVASAVVDVPVPGDAPVVTAPVAPAKKRGAKKVAEPQVPLTPQ